MRYCRAGQGDVSSQVYKILENFFSDEFQCPGPESVGLPCLKVGGSIAMSSCVSSPADTKVYECTEDFKCIEKD